MKLAQKRAKAFSVVQSSGVDENRDIADFAPDTK